MYLDRVTKRLAELAELGCLESNDQVPCTDADIASLEKQLGIRLPGAVRELYLWGGKDLGNVFGGMDVVNLEQQLQYDYRPGARETLKKSDEDPAIIDLQTLIVQVDCDGQFSFVRTDQGDDPPVYTHNDQQPTFCSCERLSDYLRLMVEQHAGVEEIQLVQDVAELEDLASPGHPASYLEVRHLQFAGGMNLGVIPEQVFTFTELRSLNLVGKGLIELSPRIGELSFLKRLDLARNSLASLPMALAELDELEELDLADNPLSTVIDVLRRMAGLRYCWLTANPLSPEETRQLRSELPRVQFTFSADGAGVDSVGDSA